MVAPTNTCSMTSGGSRGGKTKDLDDFFGQLDLDDVVFDYLVVENEILEIKDRVRWMALARVHTNKTFSQSAFFKDMRVAWNPEQPMRFMSVGVNLFVVQASCHGDWEQIMFQRAMAIQILGCTTSLI
ncbi:hypothetical protein D1007_27495 [Hordeum vulgare]|nr:hypothetical protein D1007_27495 [Hordeum vulgare]